MTATVVELLKRELKQAMDERDETYTDTDADIRAGAVAQGLRDSAQRRVDEFRAAIAMLEKADEPMQYEVSE